MPVLIRSAFDRGCVVLVVAIAALTVEALAQVQRRTPWQTGDFPPYYGRKAFPPERPFQLRPTLPVMSAVKRLTAADRRAVAALARKVIESDPNEKSSGRHDLPSRGWAVVTTAGVAKHVAEFKGDAPPQEPQNPTGSAEPRLADLPGDTRCREVETHLEALKGNELQTERLPPPDISLFCQLNGEWQPVRQ